MRGSKIPDMPLIDPQLMKARLAELAGRFDIDALDACDSTSSELMRRADRGAPSGTVIVADEQTAGRGRRGRQWMSSPASSLTFSLLWRFSCPPARLSGLSLAVGVALAQGLSDIGACGVRLKWPNDILLQGDDGACAKLAGVLVELSSDRRGTQAVIGIGLNLEKPDQDLPQAAAGLAQAVRNPDLDRHPVLAAILVALAGVLDRFAVDGFACLKTEWQQWHAWQDQPVQILGESEQPLVGLCRGVDEAGCLLLETASGIEKIHSGDVSLRRA